MSECSWKETENVLAKSVVMFLGAAAVTTEAQGGRSEMLKCSRIFVDSTVTRKGREEKRDVIRRVGRRNAQRGE